MKFLLKVLAAPIVAVLAVTVWLCVGVLYCASMVMGLACWVFVLIGVFADRIRSPGHHSSGDCVPAQSSGAAHGGALVAGTCPGPAVLHPGHCVLTAKQAGGSEPLTSLIL